MRIMYFSFILPDLLKNSSKPAGGIAVEWLNWLKALKSLDHKVGILTYIGANKYIEKSVPFDIIEAYDPNKGIKKIRILYYQIPKLISAIKSYRPNLLFQEGANAHIFLMAIVAKYTGVKFIHRLASDKDVDNRIYTMINKFEAVLFRIGIKMADHISCQNEYQYNAMKKKYPKKAISISHNPFEVKGELKKRERNYIAWIGNFRFAKNIPALAEVAVKLPQYKFKIAGGNFEKTDADAEAGLKKLKTLDNVDFAGYINNSEISNFLSEAYILLNTSRTEGFSNTFLEAWSAGTPVITTKNVNPDDLINRFNLGRVSKNYESLPYIIDDFISSKEYEKLDELCHNYVKENHNPEKLAKELLNKITRED